MLKCTTYKYDELYPRWLKNPGALLQLASYDPARDVLLDLCGGTGAAAKEAVRLGGKKIYLLDLNPRCDHPDIITIKGNAHKLSAYKSLPKIDVCVIRQSLGYLNLRVFVPVIAEVLKPGVRLAFNGFLKPKWGMKIYEYDHTWCGEISGHFLGRVAHVQASLRGIDFSVFRHHSLGEVYADFEDYFDLLQEEFTKTAFRMVFKRRLGAPSVRLDL